VSTSGLSWSFGQTIGTADPLTDTFQQLERVEALRQRGQLDQARTACELLVARHPEYFGALYTLGLIYADKGHYPQALGCLVRAVMLNPQSWKALTALTTVYLELGAGEMAAITLEQARQLEPEEPGILLTLGEIYREDCEYELAQDTYRKALAADRSLEPATIGLAVCCAYLGRHSEAAELLESVIKRGHSSHTILVELLNLKSSCVTVDVLSELEKIVRPENEDAAHFESAAAFVRATVMDRCGRHVEAWDQMVAANRTHYAHWREEAAALAKTQRANLAQLQTKSIKVKGDTGGLPLSLFILGPSRSGKTTMETLVASLAGVKRGFENPNVENAIRRTFQTASLLTSKMFEVLPPKLDPLCGDLYQKELARRAGHAKVFTNTHPARIHDVARVAAAFPNVRFIFIKRDIEDNMLRIFMRKYREANAYSYDLKSIRDHLIWYHQMIDVLAEKLPNIVRVIRYEDIVADPATALEKAKDLCGLSAGGVSLPDIGDDRGCAVPYRQWMTAALNS
jgi:tetratricopeptide (TPR) repeat protein